MIQRLFATGLAVFSFASVQYADAEGNTGARMTDHAATFGNAAGNDLANEIVARIAQLEKPRLKRLIATDQLAGELRSKCVDAVQRLVEQEDNRLLWQVVPVEDEKARRRLVSSIPRKLSLDLGEGLKWEQEVSVTWALGKLEILRSKPPVVSKLWLSFKLPTLPQLGGGDMQIGGGGNVYTQIDP
ncbi:MAG: hypothetical protein EOP87_05305 [Verrucomicrobiaceae bacterium]|nr:MAG: hypothetical protein EOP87_05305 [Verrucomicrobiaceae bacterium]